MRGPVGATNIKPPPQLLTRQGRGAAMGQGRGKGGTMEAGRKLREQNPWEWGGTVGVARPPEWTLSPTEWGGEGGREASGVTENPGGEGARSGRGSRFASGCRRSKSGRGSQGG